MDSTELSEAEDVAEAVLLIAYGCEPSASSEPGVGWNFVREISTFTNIHVITRANNKSLIDAALTNEIQSMKDNISWTFIDIAPLSKIKNKIPLGIQIYYALWQWKAMLAGRNLAKKNKFSLCHHLTYGAIWLSPITAFIMKPFVWGPIGGGDVIPWKFRREQAIRTIIQESIYSVMTYLIPRISPLAIAVRRRASIIIFRTRSTSRLYPTPGRVKKYVMCETALNKSKRLSRSQVNDTLNIVCLGRQVYWKGYIYAIKGFHEYLKNGGQGRLVFLGNGPEFHSLNSYCNRYNLHAHISLPGKVSYDEGQNVLAKSDILLHPSFRDGGSWAVLEAMEQGKPVICLNRSGLADMVDAKSGILINVNTPLQVVTDIGNTIFRLDNDRDFLQQLSRGAVDRVNGHYRWQQRRDSIKKIYRTLLSG